MDIMQHLTRIDPQTIGRDDGTFYADTEIRKYAT
jgi:hypothetical protein